MNNAILKFALIKHRCIPSFSLLNNTAFDLGLANNLQMYNVNS